MEERTTQGCLTKPERWRAGYAAQVLLLMCSSALPNAGSAKDAPQLFSTEAEQCIVPASTYHNVNPYVLRAILNVESGLNPGALGKNQNGSVDIGIGQINSIHLKELAQFGIGPAHLQETCIGTYVAAWHLKKAITARGNTWEGVASYHSRTPYFNKRYQALVINEMIRSGAMQGKLLSVPALNPSFRSADTARAGSQASGGGEDNGSTVIVFDSSVSQ